MAAGIALHAGWLVGIGSHSRFGILGHGHPSCFNNNSSGWNLFPSHILSDGVPGYDAMPSPISDCLVIGAGPAGLTSAIYLARFRLQVTVIESGHGRASSIPKTRNHAGFPNGISGKALVARMREQASLYGVHPRRGTVTALARHRAGFVAATTLGPIRARAVLLATGIADRRPPMSPAVHDRALTNGLLRYCPVCDGYEVSGKRLGVFGTGAHGAKEAEFLRSFSSDVTLINPSGRHQLTAPMRRHLKKLSVQVLDGPAAGVILKQGGLSVCIGTERHSFSTVYSALGADVHSGLAAALKAKRTSQGCLFVDAHQRTTVPGLYAAGDVVAGLNQISHAMGSAAVAAVAVRNDLAERRPLLY